MKNSILDNLTDCTEEEARLFIKQGIIKKHKNFFDSHYKKHVEMLITKAIVDFVKEHPKIDALCSKQSNVITANYKE